MFYMRLKKWKDKVTNRNTNLRTLAVLGFVHIGKYIYSKLDCKRIIVIKVEKDLEDHQV